MNASISAPNLRERRQLLVLWVAPWAFYLSTVVFTVAASYLSGRGIGWLHLLTKNEVLRVFAVLVVSLWLGARVVVAVKSKSVLLIGAVSVLELPFAFVVYLIWAVGMIGGPINPG